MKGLFIKSTLVRLFYHHTKSQLLLEWNTESVRLLENFMLGKNTRLKNNFSSQNGKGDSGARTAWNSLEVLPRPPGANQLSSYQEVRNTCLNKASKLCDRWGRCTVATEVSWADWTLMLPGDLLSSSTRLDSNNTASLLIVRKIQTPGTTKQEQAANTRHSALAFNFLLNTIRSEQCSARRGKQEHNGASVILFRKWWKKQPYYFCISKSNPASSTRLRSPYTSEPLANISTHFQ